MYLVSVIPIARGISTEELTYFSREQTAPGTLVSVPLRARTVPALVTTSAPLAEQKTSVRNAAYALKKIVDVHTPHFFSPELLRAIKATAQDHAGTIGATLASVMPQVILTNATALTHRQPQTPTTTTETHSTVIQENFAARIAHYNLKIAATLKTARSICIITPTREYAQTLQASITHPSILFHSGLTKKKILETWNAVATTTDPLVIIGTGSALTLPCPTIGLVIIEGEHSRAYRLQARPFIDTRIFAKHVAQEYKVPLIYGDDILRIETLWRLERGIYTPERAVKWHSGDVPTPVIVDMRPYTKERVSELPVLSDELCKTLENAQANHERTLIFTSRRGLAPITVCNDCGHPVLCKRCNASVVLHEDGHERSFVCHRCGTIRGASEGCATCSSWNLIPLGIGVERVEQALKKKFPEIPLFRGDADHATTTTKMVATIASWEKTDAGILLATERVLSHITTIPHTAVASFDSLFAVPDFRMHERIFHLVHTLRTHTEKTCTIQTRIPDSPILHHACSGDIRAFYRDEIAERKQFNYPPFTTLIALRTQGSKSAVVAAYDHLRTHLDAYDPILLPLVKLHMRRYLATALISLPQTQWPNDELLNMLYALPPQFAIIVDPESLT